MDKMDRALDTLLIIGLGLLVYGLSAMALIPGDAVENMVISLISGVLGYVKGTNGRGG